MTHPRIRKVSIPFLVAAVILGVAAIIAPDPQVWIPLTMAFVGFMAFWWGMYYADGIITRAQRDLDKKG